MHYIYKITNKLNDKIYIGQTNNPNRRWEQHKSGAFKNSNDCPKLYNAIRKYGFENFKLDILTNSMDIDDINILEEQYIINYDSKINGYNISNGGYNTEKSQETKDKISKAKSGINHHYFGRHLSKEHREKISKHHIEHGVSVGSKSGMYGKTQTDEVKAIISKAHLGIPRSQEVKDKISKANSGKNNASYGKKGDDGFHCKISNKQVIEIREKYKTNNYTYENLAKEYNCAKCTIGEIVRRERRNEDIE